MKYKNLPTAILAAMLLSLTACGNAQAPDKENLSAPTGTLVEPSDEGNPATDESTPVDSDSSAENETWKTGFEKSLMDNYGVTPDHYEDLGNGVYQVYVEIDGKVVPYVAVDSATGDYHG